MPMPAATTIAGVQYSYLPSWISLLADQQAVGGEAVIDHDRSESAIERGGEPRVLEPHAGAEQRRVGQRRQGEVHGRLRGSDRERPGMEPRGALREDARAFRGRLGRRGGHLRRGQRAPVRRARVGRTRVQHGERVVADEILGCQDK